MTSAVLLPGCRSLQTASERVGRATEQIRNDSVYVHDSVYIRIRADTVYLERWHTRWREKERVRTDTITQTVTQTETINVPYVPVFYRYCTAFAVLMLVAGVVRIVYPLLIKTLNVKRLFI